MKVLFLSIKGGVGKSSIAVNFATYTNSFYITNDIVCTQDKQFAQIEPNKKHIPLRYLSKSDLVIDFGGMYSQLDPKITKAVRLADVIIIPTLTDTRSLEATILTVQLVKPAGKPIVIIINNFKDQKKCDAARQLLFDRLGRLPIFEIRTTTLFERVSLDGREWYANIHNDKGQYQLNKTRIQHEVIYDHIIAIGERG